MNNKFFPTNFMLIMMMMMGTIMSLSSPHWLMMWMGLELNLMGILPLMNIKSNNLEIESSMKYFIIQSLSSSLFIMSTIFMFFNSATMYSMFNNNLFSTIMIISLLIKMGTAPFHMWLTSMCKYMSWMTLFLILTWQKLGPLFMLSFINTNLIIIIIMSLFSTILGSIQMINQSNLQLIMTYSSISHLGWMLPASYMNNLIMLIYLIIYSLITLPLFIFFSSKSSFYCYSLTENLTTMNKNNIFMMMMMMSLGGMPPMLGFMSKLMMLNLLINMHMFFLPIFLFMGTLISLFFYLNLCCMLMIKSYFLFKIKSTNLKLKLILCLNIMGSFLFLPILMLYAMNIFNKS
uniref:NADH dehydrogenase subunit 2 n=1 Tax=Amphitretus pelagicus TaxID=168639 RepID=UPI00226D270C|nr:NADH dehydrogenase subunit 2 [Amphitretus pelagicus]UZN92540.1 NADH dehydrogenase subunit 2 [Amphitretus pelagicus]